MTEQGTQVWELPPKLSLPFWKILPSRWFSYKKILVQQQKYPLNINQIETQKKQICCRKNSHIESPKDTSENVPDFFRRKKNI